MEMVNNAKIILPCNAVDRRSSSWQAFSTTSIWYIKQCSTESSASIITQCCTVRRPLKERSHERMKVRVRLCFWMDLLHFKNTHKRYDVRYLFVINILRLKISKQIYLSTIVWTKPFVAWYCNADSSVFLRHKGAAVFYSSTHIIMCSSTGGHQWQANPLFPKLLSLVCCQLIKMCSPRSFLLITH